MDYDEKKIDIDQWDEFRIFRLFSALDISSENMLDFMRDFMRENPTKEGVLFDIVVESGEKSGQISRVAPEGILTIMETVKYPPEPVKKRLHIMVLYAAMITTGDLLK